MSYGRNDHGTFSMHFSNINKKKILFSKEEMVIVE
jgi:hypothetical protein